MDYIKVGCTGVYYHPPVQTIEGDLEMEKEMREVTKADNVVVLGDFSYPHIDWANVLKSCCRNGIPRCHK